MIALCQDHRLEHGTKHIALRYFLARELQQRGQLRLAYVATRADTADVFTKALPPAAVGGGDLQQQWGEGICSSSGGRGVAASAPPPFFSSTPAAGAAEGGGDLQPCAALQPCAPYAPCCPAALQPCAPYGRAAAATALAAVLRALQPCCALRALLPCCPVRALLPSACAMHSPVHEPAAPVACGSVAPAAQS
ncbi:unnamed protein product [Closterium sp. NIES-53]